VDLISANLDANTLSVLTNNGSGGFVLASSLATGPRPIQVVAADVNGDGKLDLISANNGDRTLSVLTNNGSGGFVASSPDVSTGSSYTHISIVAADVNGDGKVDLISANYGSPGTLSVLTNKGGGGFVFASSLAVGDYPWAVTAADVNGDGKMDLISANDTVSTLTVLTNAGPGGFVLASSPAVGSRPRSVVGGGCQRRRQGGFDQCEQWFPWLAFGADQYRQRRLCARFLAGRGQRRQLTYVVVAADVNGDGRLDLISANYHDKTLSVLTNTWILAAQERFAVRGSFTPEGGVRVPGATTIEFGAGILGKDANAGKIGYQTFTSNALDIVGAGLNIPNRRIHFFNEGGAHSMAQSASARTPQRRNCTSSATSSPAAPSPQQRPQCEGKLCACGPPRGARQVAALPISRWNYKTEATVTHLGPMAQDFIPRSRLGWTTNTSAWWTPTAWRWRPSKG